MSFTLMKRAYVLGTIQICENSMTLSTPPPPSTTVYRTIRTMHGTHPTSRTFPEESLIGSTFAKLHEAYATHFISYPLSQVHIPIIKHCLTHATLHVHFKESCVISPRCIRHNTFPMKVVVHETSLILVPIGVNKNPLTMSSSLVILSIIGTLVTICHHSLPFTKVVLPFSNVYLTRGYVSHRSLSATHIITELSFIRISICT
mmetsp:Transcript_4054/g.6284  ORF Transcript_4054/g.6284 Transcript_4054/m.6284 type:complete len:203 (-) Transcript_4054:797-1405(-)